MARRRWHGVSIADGRLWIGPLGGLTRRARARFEVAGPTLITRSGDMALRWDDGFPAHISTPEHWLAEGMAGSRASVPSVDILTQMDRWGRGTRTRITGGAHAGLVGIASTHIPALMQYLTMTPAARGGLVDTARLEWLLDELARDFSWITGVRHPPSGGTLRGGDHLDLENAAERVLASEWPRRIMGRPIRGEPIPVVADLIDPVRTRLPARIRDHITDEQIAGQLEKQLRIDPWRFDALTAPYP